MHRQESTTRRQFLAAGIALALLVPAASAFAHDNHGAIVRLDQYAGPLWDVTTRGGEVYRVDTIIRVSAERTIVRYPRGTATIVYRTDSGQRHLIDSNGWGFEVVG